MRGMSETLMSDVMVPDHSYVHELCGLTFDSQYKNIAQWTLTRKISKNHKNCKKLEGGYLLSVGRLPRTIR